MFKFPLTLACATLITASCSSPSAEPPSTTATATSAPVTIDVCGTPVTWTAPPERVFVNDINMLEMLLALDLQDRIVASFLWGEDDTVLPDLRAKMDAVGLKPVIGSINDEIETVLSYDPDFLFAGWNYGLRVGGVLTPDMLADKGVKTYLLRESCRHVQPELGRTTMDDIYFDLRSLGAIFGVEDRAQALIAQYQTTIQQAAALVPEDLEGRVDLFLYDSGDDEPFTAGFFAIPDEMFRLVGARNIIDDVNKTWTKVSWERVISRDPVLIPVVAYDGVSCDERIATLKSLPALRSIPAIVNDRYHCFEYADVVPGIRTAEATLELGKVLWTTP
jgi:iron complex transport system substrate-binding protein